MAFRYGAEPPLLHQFPGATAAYSLKRIGGRAFTGSFAIRVRRSSDNTEQNIGFNSVGGLDTSALTSFVGANSAFVVKWYDQSGNGRDAYQAVAGNDPRIVNAGVIDSSGGTTGILFDGSNDFLLFDGTNIVNYGTGNLTTYFYANQVTNTSTRTFIDARSTAGGVPWAIETSTSKLSVYNGVPNTSSTNTIAGTWYGHFHTRNSTTSKLFQGNLEVLSWTDSVNYTGGQSVNRIGAGLSNVNYINAYVNTLVIWKGVGMSQSNIEKINYLIR